MARSKKATPAKPDRSTLTERQQRILAVIEDAIRFRGYAPSIREIGDASGLQSTSSVAYQLRELERKGFLRRDPNKPRAVDIRSIERTDPNNQQQEDDPRNLLPTTYVPIVGQIAAGTPILAEQNVDEYYPIPQNLVGEGELFMLAVVGDSMVDAGILNGDYVIIRQQPTVEPGEFCAAMIEGEATVKEFHRDETGVWLLPHNVSFDPIDASEAEILGRVVFVMRSL